MVFYQIQGKLDEANTTCAQIDTEKKAIEAETRLRCAVAYGGLPPESRSQQAKLFNEPNSGYDVLVASDAIGMGLNL